MVNIIATFYYFFLQVASDTLLTTKSELEAARSAAEVLHDQGGHPHAALLSNRAKLPTEGCRARCCLLFPRSLLIYWN